MARKEKRRGLAEDVAAYRHLARPSLTGTVADLDARYGLDRKEAAKAAAKAVGAAAAAVVGIKTGAFASPNFLPGLVGALFEAAGTVLGTRQRQQSDEGRLWALVRGALDLAWLTIAKEALAAEKRDPARLEAAVATSLDAAVQHQAITIDDGFFTRPETLPVVRLAREALARWLSEAMGIGAVQADGAAGYLPAAFVAALRAVTAREPEAVAGIADRLTTPFDTADERLRARAAYAARLEADLALPLFDGPASLRDLYQPLRAFWIAEREEPDAERLDARHGEIGRFHEKRHVVDLATALNTWIEASDPADALRVVSGGPGSGKSSFARWWAAKLAGEGNRVLLVPLHRLQDTAGALADRIDRFARDRAHLAEDPLRSTEPLLLILDGLDELVMQGHSGTEVALSLVRDIEQVLRDSHEDGLGLRVLLGGREVLVDRLKGRLPLHAIFHLLPYRLSKEEHGRSNCEWDDSDDLLNAVDQPENDLRHTWWRAWGAVTGEKLDGVPAEIESQAKLAVLSEQPLLNFLLALVRQVPGGLSADANVNTVYAGLLHDVWRRRWGAPRGREDGRVEAHKGLSIEAFERVFQAIALAAWHGGATRAVTTQAIREAIERERLAEQLQLLQEAGQEGALRLLTAFYWREAGVGASGERAWELTHKSFGEYLVARRLVRAMERIADMRERNQREADDGWTVERALVEWIALAGPNVLDDDLIGMLRGEVASRGKEAAAAWQRALVELLGWYLRHDLPMHKADPAIPTFQEAGRQARNATRALIASMNACARVSKEVSRPVWPNHDPVIGHNISACYELIRLAIGKVGILYHSPSSYMVHSSIDLLSHIDFSDQVIFGAQLSEQNLTMCIFARCTLVGTNLVKADLTGADLNHARMHFVNLQSSTLSRADLTGADLTGADLTGADLTGADLTGAHGLTRKQLGKTQGVEAALLPYNLPEE